MRMYLSIDRGSDVIKLSVPTYYIRAIVHLLQSGQTTRYALITLIDIFNNRAASCGSTTQIDEQAHLTAEGIQFLKVFLYLLQFLLHQSTHLGANILRVLTHFQELADFGQRKVHALCAPNEFQSRDVLVVINPQSRVAAAYLPNQQLIGNNYFPAYKKSLQITLTIVFVITLLLTLPSFFPSFNMIATSVRLLSNLLNNATNVFAVVTLTFYLMQKYNANLDEIYSWSPKDIKEKNPKLSISRLETFIELIFQVLFLSWWNGLFSLPLTLSDKSLFIVGSFSPEWAIVMLPVNVIIAAGIAISIHKLVISGWNKRTLIGNLLLNIATLFMLYQISGFTTYVIFDNALLQHQNIVKLTSVIEKSTSIILAVITLITIGDSWSSIKWLKQK